MPVRSTFCGVVRASSRTFASADALAAASHPSTSSDASASAIPAACISASDSANSRPFSIAVMMKLVVLLTTPLKPEIRTAGSVSRTMLKMGIPSITAPSNRNARSAVRASSASSAYANAAGPLLAVMTCAPARSPARTWSIAGWPAAMSSTVVSTTTSGRVLPAARAASASCSIN